MLVHIVKNMFVYKTLSIRERKKIPVDIQILTESLGEILHIQTSIWTISEEVLL